MKVAVHIHSDWSYDGSWTLGDIAALFARRGYDAVLLTEHDRGFSPKRWREYRTACAQASSPSLLLVPGIEYSDASNTVHVLVWGDIPFLGEGLATLALLTRVREHGGLAVLAHPARRSAWRHFQPAWIPLLLGIEVWNRKTDGWAPSRSAGRLLEGTGLLPFVGMDFHSTRQLFPLAVALPPDTTQSEQSILASLRARSINSSGLGLRTEADGVRPRFVGQFLHIAEVFRRIAAYPVRRLRRNRRAPAIKEVH